MDQNGQTAKAFVELGSSRGCLQGWQGEQTELRSGLPWGSDYTARPLLFPDQLATICQASAKNPEKSFDI